MSHIKPRILIIVRVGKRSIHRAWLWTLHGLADVGLSVYDDADVSGDGAMFVHRYVGGKFPGLSDFFLTFPKALNEYDFFWLFEDDLFLPWESLREALRILRIFPFDLAAPALSQCSYFSWPLTVCNSRFLFRGTNFVEVMAPIMSRAFLCLALPAFNENFSGWGHEWLWQKLLKDRRSFAGVLDSAPITHTRPFGGGPLYANRPATGWTPREDLDRMVVKYGLDRNVKFRNYFAVTKERPHRLLVQDDLVQYGLSGYADMKDALHDDYSRCVDSFVGDSRPVMPLLSLREFPSFRTIEDALIYEPDVKID